MQNNKTVRRILKTVVSAGFTFAYTLAGAQSLQLANAPLQATGTVQPNLMILLDSSGSMDGKIGNQTRLKIVQDAAKGLLDSIPDKSMRVGYSIFDYETGAEVRNNIAELTPSWRDAIKQQITNTKAEDWTPLAESVMDIGRYFTYGYSGNLTLHPDSGFGKTPTSASVSDIFSSSIAFGNSEQAPSEVMQYYCQKNFMIALTDGLPTKDRGISEKLKDYATRCDPSVQSCSNKTNGYGDDGSAYLADVAAALYDMDLRPDLDDDNGNEVKNNVTSYFVGFAAGNLKDNQLLTDAGKLGGGGYIYTSNAQELADAFNSAIGSIANSIGSQSSVSFNSTSLDIGSVIYSAQFDTTDNSGRLFARAMDPETGRIANTLWDAGEKLARRSDARQIITTLNGTGVPFTAESLGGTTTASSHTVTVRLRGRDDSDRDVRLEVGGETVWTKANIGMTYATYSIPVSNTVNATSKIRLTCDNCSPFFGSRRIEVDYLTVNEGARQSGGTISSYGGYIEFCSFEECGAVSYTPHREDLRVNAQSGEKDNNWEHRLNYIRGVTSKDGNDGFRRRGTFNSGTAFGNIKRLGDIVHSTPIYVAKPELNWPTNFATSKKSYAQFQLDKANRSPMVYVGANDGMLHGFRASDGEEVFAYIPSLLLSSAQAEGLHAFTSTAYNHRYYVDQTPAVSDVFITPRNANSDEWRTVLVGGLRGGGKGYFALDVTNPNTVGTDNLSAAEANASNIVMWEFDGGDSTGRANLGLGFSEVQIAKLNNGKWAAIFGNGYNSDNGVAGLFIVYIEEGIDGWQAGDWKFISTGAGSANSGRKNGLSSPRLIDLNNDRIVDRVYAGDLHGNMWAFNLSAGQDSSWSVDYSGKPLFSVGNSEAHNAITAAPMVARNTAVPNGTSPNVLVLFGTGQYLASTDLRESSGSGFYAVWDKGDAELDTDNLVARAPVDSTSGRSISNATRTQIDWATKYGWYLSLNNASGNFAAERVVSAAALRRNTLFFSTIIPNPQPCASSGTGWQMSLDFRTGLPEDGLRRPVTDFNNDGEINEDDSGYVGKIYDNPACTGEDCDDTVDLPPGMPGQPGFIGDVRCTPGSAGNVICDDIDVGKEEREGRLSWEEFSPR